MRSKERYKIASNCAFNINFSKIYCKKVTFFPFKIFRIVYNVNNWKKSTKQKMFKIVSMLITYGFSNLTKFDYDYKYVYKYDYDYWRNIAM